MISTTWRNKKPLAGEDYPRLEVDVPRGSWMDNQRIRDVILSSTPRCPREIILFGHNLYR